MPSGEDIRGIFGDTRGLKTTAMSKPERARITNRFGPQVRLHRAGVGLTGLALGIGRLGVGSIKIVVCRLRLRRGTPAHRRLKPINALPGAGTNGLPGTGTAMSQPKVGLSRGTGIIDNLGDGRAPR